MGDIVETIMANLQAISCDPYGNYVVQNLLENGSAEQQRRIADVIHKDICLFVSDSFGCAVVSATLFQGQREAQLIIAGALLKNPDVLVFMACTKHGHKGVVRMLELFHHVGKSLLHERM